MFECNLRGQQYAVLWLVFAGAFSYRENTCYDRGYDYELGIDKVKVSLCI